MAKQAVGPIVRHLDKAVLAVCGGAFLYVVAMFGALSPNQVGPEGGEKLTAAEVDVEVKKAAETLRNNLLNVEAPTIEVPDPMREIERVRDPLVLAGVEETLPCAVGFNLPVPNVLGTSAQLTDKRSLVEVYAPASPVCMAGRSGWYMAPPSEFDAKETSGSRDEIFLRDVNWVTVTTVFDRKAQEEAARRAGYDVKRIETIFLGSDIERRMRLADGSYSAWEAIPAIAQRGKPAYPAPKVYEADRGHNVSPEDRAAVEAFIELIKAGDSQLALMRPLPLPREYGDEWLYPRVEGYDLLAMDAEYQETPHCRYPECSDTEVAIDPKASSRELRKQAKAALDDGNFKKAERLAQEAKTRKTSDRQEKDAEELLDKIEKARKAAEQSPATRQHAAKQIFWAHDAGLDSVLSGRTYQYRSRVRIYNRYCGTPTLLENPLDAETVELVSPWSEPSEPVTIEWDTLVFAKSAKAKKKSCKVEVFKWVQGEWLMRAFEVKVGERIAKRVRVETPRSDLKEEINFDAGATVVDLDFRHSYRGRDRKGRLERLGETMVLVYVDDNNLLHEHLLDFDKTSAAYKKMKALLWRPKKKR